MKNPESLVVSARVTRPLALAIEKYLSLNAHVSPSDFIRDAIREKLDRDASWILNELLRPTETEAGISPIQDAGKDGGEL
jgi:Arc/MetJ-type ribon-helix-helix transcriptional regulator